LLWYVGGIAAAAAIGWVAAMCHLGGWAPVGLVSLGIGLTLGLVLSKLAAITHVIGWRQLVVGAVIFALITVLVEHTWLYRDFRRQWQEARAAEPHVALFRPAEPWSPAQYFRHEMTPGRAALWCVDAALIVAGAAATVMVWQRQHQ
jgi:hypothetical protein